MAAWTDLEKDLLLTMGRSRRGEQYYGRDERLEGYSQMDKWCLFTTKMIGLKAIEQEVHGLEDSQDGIWIIMNLSISLIMLIL
jgi:hypothetical protein